VNAQQDDARGSTLEGDVHAVVNAGVATGMSEARSILAPWEENAHARVRKAVRPTARGKLEKANSVSVV
jgi:hypothetical protein